MSDQTDALASAVATGANNNVEVQRLQSARDVWTSVNQVNRVVSKSRIDSDLVYGAAVPKLSGQPKTPEMSRKVSLNQDPIPEDHIDAHSHNKPGLRLILLRSLGCMGVIWGDIGTSPLYAYSAVYNCSSTCDVPSQEDIKGTLACIIWSLIFVVFIKYLAVVMSCDFHGEGGIFALLRLIRSESKRALSDRSVLFFTTIAAIGASSMIADGLITPALSVLAAIEGLEDPRIFGDKILNWIVPITVILLLCLYGIQFKGTTTVGRVFGPIMFLYFFCIGAVGIYNIITLQNHWVLEGWSPVYVFKFWFSGNYSGLKAFKIMGSVVLAVTGAEAMYADLGHFGKSPIYISWIFVVFPSLVLSYTGQAYFIASYPEQISTVFFSSIPSAVYVPMWIICTLATIIASQAMITGCYSIVSQGVTLGLLPRIQTFNTDPTQKAQIYIPSVCALLACGTIALVLVFRSSEKLAGAYGIAVLLTFIMSDIMIAGALNLVKLPKIPTIFICIIIAPFCFVDCVFLAANIYSKIANGGWLPLVLAFIIATLMSTWRYGRRRTSLAYNKQRENVKLDYLYSIEKLVDAVKRGDIGSTPGTGVFLCPAWVEPLSGDALPSTLGLFLRITGSIPRKAILLTVSFDKNLPFVNENEKRRVVEIVPGIYSMSFNYGFAEPLSELKITEKLIELLPSLVDRENRPNITSTFNTLSGLWFFIHSENIETKNSRNFFSRLVIKLYATMLAMSSSAGSFFGLSSDRVVQLGDVLQI